MLTGIALATTGAVVLAGAANATRAEVASTLDTNIHGAYDILVRPRGARTEVERQQGRVQANYLSGLYGGITVEQWRRIMAIREVEVAAPVAMIGYVRTLGFTSVDLTSRLDPKATRQVFRLGRTWQADRGTSTVADAAQYVYVTRRPLVRVDDSKPAREQVFYVDGSVMPNTGPCPFSPVEILDDGSRHRLCPPSGLLDKTSGTTLAERTELFAVQWLADGRFKPASGSADIVPTLRARIAWPIMTLMAGIDPAQEDRLVGLGDAVTSGRLLRSSDGTEVTTDPVYQTSTDVIPVMMSEKTYIDETMSVRVEGLPAAIADRVPRSETPSQQYDTLRVATGQPVAMSQHAIDDAYRSALLDSTDAAAVDLNVVVQSSPPRYTGADDRLIPEQTQNDPDLWRRGGTGSATGVPALAADDAYRRLRRAPHSSRLDVQARRVGTYLPGRLRSFGELTKVPLETYFPPDAAGADVAGREALGDRVMLPSNSPGSYLGSPPLLLTTLAAAPSLLGMSNAESAPMISAIRVRISGVERYSETVISKVRAVAATIMRETGLDVDVTVGASPAAQVVELAAGRFGRPRLLLNEPWTQLGAAATIRAATETNAAALSVLLVLMCVLFLATTVSASVRSRVAEFAMLRCSGWSPRWVGLLVLLEVGLIGLAGGALALAGLPFAAHALGLQIRWDQAVWALAVGLAISAGAAAVPALRAAVRPPARGLTPLGTSTVRSAGAVTVRNLAWSTLRRFPGRTALGVVSFAVPVFAVTASVAVNIAFSQSVTGTSLGDAVAAQVTIRSVSILLVVFVLSIMSVSDILYINARERSPEIGLLRATGWPGFALASVTLWESLIIGAAGGVLGFGVGLIFSALSIGSFTTHLVMPMSIIAAAVVPISGIAALVPIALMHRTPLATLLNEE